MTEEEAKTKWCPFVRLVAGGAREASAAIGGHSAAGYNMVAIAGGSGSLSPHAARCRGTACMAWRTINTPDGLYQVGYCGLAGVPQ